jgi:hypothetical protein
MPTRYKPLCVFTSRPEVPWFGEMTLPPDIKRVVTALACLPRVEDVSETPLVTAGWCGACPSWETHFCRRRAPGGWAQERELALILGNRS